MYSFILLTAALAMLPSVQAAPKGDEIQSGYWIELDCYVGNVQIDGRFVDSDRSLKYDWQLTQQNCVNNYKGLVSES